MKFVFESHNHTTGIGHTVLAAIVAAVGITEGKKLFARMVPVRWKDIQPSAIMVPRECTRQGDVLTPEKSRGHTNYVIHGVIYH